MTEALFEGLSQAVIEGEPDRAKEGVGGASPVLHEEGYHE